MGFFELPEPDPDEHHDARDDRWGSSPLYTPWIGGIVPLQLVVGRSSEAVVIAERITAFPDGFELTISSFIRRTVARGRRRNMWPMHNQMIEPGDPVSDEMLRFGLAWPDGGRATNLDGWGLHWPDATPPLHVLEEGGGGGSEH